MELHEPSAIRAQPAERSEPAPAEQAQRRPSAIAGWFGDPTEATFGWLHQPETGQVRGAVVLCPPLFSEYLPSHGALRKLAEQLAAQGFAALRFDWRYTGDSSGSPGSCNGVAAWLEDVSRAVGLLRRGNAAWICLLGMRASALLAACSIEATEADCLVLWDPSASGKAVLRENKLLLDTTLRGAYPKKLAHLYRPPPEPVPGWEYPPSFASDMAKLAFARSAPGGVPTLVLSPQARLPRPLVEWPSKDGVDRETIEGQAQLLDRGIVPPLTIPMIVRWLDSKAPRPRRPLSVQLRDQAVLAWGGTSVSERPIRIGSRGLFAILSEPLGERRGPAIVCFNSGTEHHVGPSRFYVDLTRRLSAEGLRCVRLDLKGLGDSPGRFESARDIVYPLEALHDVVEVAAAASPEDPSDVVFTGLCSGGYHSIEAALRVGAKGVCAIHTDLDFDGDKRQRPFHHPDRLAWVPDSAIVSLLDHTRLGERIRWHLPEVAWRVLRLLGLQKDIAKGLSDLVESGSQVLFISERWRLARPRLWKLRKLGSSGQVELTSVTDFDHSLHTLGARAHALTRVREHVQDITESASSRQCSTPAPPPTRAAPGGSERARSARARPGGPVSRSA